jgi:hypothetical protein
MNTISTKGRVGGEVSDGLMMGLAVFFGKF